MADTPAKAPLYPKRWFFSVKLQGEDGYFPVSAFAVTEEKAMRCLQDRFSDQIEHFRPKKQIQVG